MNQKYEYKHVRIRYVNQVESYCNEQAKAGWRTVSMQYDFYNDINGFHQVAYVDLLLERDYMAAVLFEGQKESSLHEMPNLHSTPNLHS